MVAWWQTLQASPTGISYRTTLDRTAVWVGDQFHYLSTMDYTPQYEFVLLRKNRLRR